MNEYSDEQIIEGLSKEDINVTLKVLRHINYRSAYGHNPAFCKSSNELLRLLDKSCLDGWNPSVTHQDRMDALVAHCRRSSEQLKEVLIANETV